MQRIPLQSVPNQTLAVALARQNTQIALRQNGLNIYFDLLLNNAYIVRARICRDRQRLLLDAQYRGFVGDFIFIDSQRSLDAAADPYYTGLGSRFQLLYLAPGE